MRETPEQEGPPIVSCPHCGSMVPSGEFCGHCGAHLPTGSIRRSHAYAAVPTQRVAHLAIVSTLFPHLAYRRSGPFRIALVAGGALVVMLAALHLFAPATVAAVFALPVLYLMYLYEVEVYEDEPWLIVGATMVLGALLGRQETLEHCMAALVTDVETEGESRTERVLHTVMLGDLLAIELANARGVDPLTVGVLEGFKKEMGRPDGS